VHLLEKSKAWKFLAIQKFADRVLRSSRVCDACHEMLHEGRVVQPGKIKYIVLSISIWMHFIIFAQAPRISHHCKAHSPFHQSVHTQIITYSTTNNYCMYIISIYFPRFPFNNNSFASLIFPETYVDPPVSVTEIVCNAKWETNSHKSSKKCIQEQQDVETLLFFKTGCTLIIRTWMVQDQ